MVIFLATITFVPDLKNVEDTTKTYSKSLTLTYKGYNSALIQSDIIKFLDKENLPRSSKVTFGRLIGGAPTSQNIDNGYLLALKFSIDLQRDQVLYFLDTRFDIKSSNLVPDKSVTMQLTFQPPA